jgi:hypothetical protein
MCDSQEPLIGDAVGMVLAAILIVQDFAAAIAVSSIDTIIFLPCNIIPIIFLMFNN